MLSKEEKPEWQKLCEECSTVIKEAGFTKSDTDRIIKETREMIKKANKYDSLVKKIKDNIEEQKEVLNHYDEYTKLNILEKLIVDSIDTRIEVLQELLKEAEDE